jgi:hypothetical protein
MGGDVRYPSLYQINTRVWLRRLSRQGKTVTLKEVPDEERSVIMSSVIDRSSVQVVGLPTDPIPEIDDDRPRSRSLATALHKGALASGSPPPSYNHYPGRNPASNGRE